MNKLQKFFLFTALVTLSLKGKSQTFVVVGSVASTEGEFNPLAAGEEIATIFETKKIVAKGKPRISFTEKAPVEESAYWANQHGTVKRF